MDPNRTDSEDELNDDVSATTAAVVGEKRKRGIYTRGNKFRIQKIDTITGKRTTCTFATFSEAETAYMTWHASQSEHRRQLAARPHIEIRADNVAKYGNNSKFERAVALEFCKVDESLDVVNDQMLADLCGFFYEHDHTLALGIQLKVARSHRRGTPNTWEFSNVTGYTGMPVVFWRDDKKDGWVYDGTCLGERTAKNLKITPGGANANLALNGPNPLDMHDVVAFIKNNIATQPGRFPPRTKEYLSWQVGGKHAHNCIKERVCIYLYKNHIDSKATFPNDQNGPYDLLAGDGKRRLQFKTARVVKGQTGLSTPLHQYAGSSNGTSKCRPYQLDAFDELVVYYLDWSAGMAHVWCIPATELVTRGYMCTAAQSGKQGILVYIPGAGRSSRNNRSCDTWTTGYYQPTQPIGAFPAEAEAAAGHLLSDLRSGRVV
jgi:hypothetical protein